MLNTQVRGRWSAALGAVLVAALVVSACGRDGAGYAGQVQVEANNSAENNSSSSGNNAATENNSAANNSVEVNNGVNNGVNNAVNNLPPVPEGAEDGSPCAVGGLCANGECLGERDGYVGGYCTGLGCAEGEVTCTENAQCASLGDAAGTSACFDRCGGADGACREG